MKITKQLCLKQLKQTDIIIYIPAWITTKFWVRVNKDDITSAILHCVKDNDKIEFTQTGNCLYIGEEQDYETLV